MLGSTHGEGPEDHAQVKRALGKVNVNTISKRVNLDHIPLFHLVRRIFLIVCFSFPDLVLAVSHVIPPL